MLGHSLKARMENHGKDICTDTKQAISFAIWAVDKKGLETDKELGYQARMFRITWKKI